MELHDDCLPDGSYPMNQELPSRCLKQRRVVFPKKLNCYHIWPCSDGNEDIPNKEYLLNKNEENITKDPNCYSYNTDDTPERSQNYSKEMNSITSKHSCNHDIEVLSKSNKGLEKVAKFNNHVNSLTCLTCSKVFRSKDMMLRHEMCHAGSKPYLCDVCQAGLSSAVALKEHKAMHTQQKLYECKTCQKSFRQNSSYRRHLNIHLKMYPFECSTCKRRFSQRSYLRSHITTHSGQKPHSCSQCGKAFAHLSDLNRHKIIHTGERPYKCNICGSSFADNSSRRRHQKEHENKTMKLTCKECDIHFEKAYEMKKHFFHTHLQIFTSCKGMKCGNKRSKVIKNKSKNDVRLKSNNLLFRETELHVFPTTISVPKYIEEKNIASGMLSNDVLMKKNNSSEMLSGDMAIKKNNLFSEGNCNAIHTVQSGYAESGTQSGSVEECRECENVNSLPIIGCLDVEETFKVSTEKLASTLAQSVRPASLQMFDCNYITHPDFNSEDYYSWLTEFVSFCKVLTPPIKSDLFNKISQVHKALSDVLASPSGILCSKLNFKVLLNLSQVLLEITNGHLNFVFNQLQD